ncbi:hypothetical protein PSV3_00290 [Septimatrevirus PSV34]|uniref:Uncharacterized protein n=1 Tax=Pseudomonas phage PSV3 TaxID=3003632 RepID=A0AAE9VXY4_9CAUD|nr:hypothetical protein PM407_gp11 [Pseudomonas phage PSV3]WBF76991.1 hypothetical protein PSV3_00290 [Pseudomonas phage PSV3]
MKPAKILFFVDGNAPTPEDFAAAAELNAQVMFRNARAVPSEPHSLEICDGVAGKVPKLYADAYPEAGEAIKKKAAELKALRTAFAGNLRRRSGQGSEAVRRRLPGSGRSNQEEGRRTESPCFKGRRRPGTEGQQQGRRQARSRYAGPDPGPDPGAGPESPAGRQRPGLEPQPGAVTNGRPVAYCGQAVSTTN